MTDPCRSALDILNISFENLGDGDVFYIGVIELMIVKDIGRCPKTRKKC